MKPYNTKRCLTTVAACLLLTLTALTATAQRQKPVKTRVMTFNIRLENKSDGINNWEMRFLQVGNFLRNSKADIIGMQEVKQIQLDDICKALPGYGYVGVARDDGKQRGEYCPLFYNKEKFDLIKSGTFWLSETPDTPSKSWGAACYRIATWAILRDKETFKNIVAVNTHLDHVSDLARQNGATLIKERISRMTNELPVVLTGDFNVNDNDPAYAKITTRIFPMQDTWKAVKSPKGPSYTFHDFGKLAPPEAQKIDFIFASSKIQVKKSTVISSALGGERFLSDHNPQTADIVF